LSFAFVGKTGKAPQAKTRLVPRLNSFGIHFSAPRGLLCFQRVKKFCSELASRLSFHARLARVVPAEFAALLPVDPIPSFYFDGVAVSELDRLGVSELIKILRLKSTTRLFCSFLKLFYNLTTFIAADVTALLQRFHPADGWRSMVCVLDF
jgi:hypothetical protein